MVIAKERGIRVTETKIDQIRDFANLIIVEVETDKMKSSLTGTLFTKAYPFFPAFLTLYIAWSASLIN